MIRRPPRSTLSSSSAASDVYKRQVLEMAAAFKVLPQVEIKKCFFGLSTSMTYQKTNSKIHIIQNEYDASNGKLLEDTLLTSPEKLVEVGVPAKDIKKSSIGNYRLDICLSDDKQFLATQLLRFVNFNYVEITDMKVFEGKAAEIIAEIILAS